MARLAKHVPEIGKSYTTNNFGDVVVTYFKSSIDVGVIFGSGFKRSVTVGNLLKGKVLDPTVPKPKWKVTTTLEGFLEDSHKEHEDLYDYSKVIYVDTKTDVEIICREEGHGSFWQSPYNHRNGAGCSICAGKAPMTADRFKAKSPHSSGKYDYSLVQDHHFIRTENKVPEVPIICDVHGLFSQKYDNHLSGQGCSKCASYGFNIGKAGTLYVLTDSSRVKVGITNRTVGTRLKEINKPDGNFTILAQYQYNSGAECKSHESAILKFMRQNYKNTEGDFDGVTESFEDVDFPLVLSEIDKIRREQGNGD